MLTIYANGQGGKHRDNAEARGWRQLTAQIAQAMLASPRYSDPVIVQALAEDEAARTYRTLNRGEVARSLPGGAS